MALTAYAVLVQLRTADLPTAPPRPPASAGPALDTRATTATPDALLRLSPARSLLSGAQIVAFYGNPLSPEMGILGQHDPGTLAELLRAHRDRIDEQNGPLGAIGAFELVVAVAQPSPGREGLYLQRLDPVIIEEYAQLAQRHGFLLVLDLQIGRSDVASEIAPLIPFLRRPGVHLALDPEFAVGPDGIPGERIGALSAQEIGAAQWVLSRLVAEGLPERKVLIVHQFREDMIEDPDSLRHLPGVDLVIDMDGFGPGHVKRAQYEAFGGAAHAPFAGIKLFLEHDPGLLTETDLLNLAPRPALVVYQ